MPVFGPKSEVYPINPFAMDKEGNGKGALFPEEAHIRSHREYGKIPVPNLDTLKKWVGVKKKEPTQPPKAGPYTTRLATVDSNDEFVYSRLKRDILAEGYELIEMPVKDLRNKYGDNKILGYEECDEIFIGSDISASDKVDAAAHELAAKRLRRTRRDFDHMRDHGDVFRAGDVLARQYRMNRDAPVYRMAA